MDDTIKTTVLLSNTNQQKDNIEIEFQTIFGNDIDLDPSGSFGQIIGIFAKLIKKLKDNGELHKIDFIKMTENPNIKPVIKKQYKTRFNCLEMD
jgi:hypothetical protein